MSEPTSSETIPSDLSGLGKWGIFLEALRGSHRDFTQESLGLSIVLLAIPMILEMVMESIFAVVDIFFVGKLGPHAVATIGLTESLLTFVYIVAIGLSIGATATVARRIGERNPRAAGNAAVQALGLGMLVGISFGIVGYLLAPRLLSFMGASEEVLSQGVGYARVMLGGNIVIMLLFLTNAIFRGAGDGAIAMRALWLANGINIFLGPCLIFGLGPFPKMGIIGAGIATTCGRGTGAIYVISRLFRKGSRLRVGRSDLHLDLKVLMSVVRLSSAGTLQVFISMSSWIGMMRILSNFGSIALAGYTIGMRVILLALFPSFGLSNAAATLVGQSLGAKNPERAERAVWIAGFYNMCFLGAIGAIFVVYAGPIVGLFTADLGVISYGRDCLRTVACGFLFYAYGIVLTQSFNGAGDTWTPTVINLVIFWLWEIPLAYFLAVPMGIGPHGIFLSVTIAFSSLAIVSAVAFKRGKWKLKAV